MAMIMPGYEARPALRASHGRSAGSAITVEPERRAEAARPRGAPPAGPGVGRPSDALHRRLGPFGPQLEHQPSGRDSADAGRALQMGRGRATPLARHRRRDDARQRLAAGRRGAGGRCRARAWRINSSADRPSLNGAPISASISTVSLGLARGPGRGPAPRAAGVAVDADGDISFQPMRRAMARRHRRSTPPRRGRTAAGDAAPGRRRRLDTELRRSDLRTSIHRWQMADGRASHHLIDRRTGRPADTDVVQATVIAPTAREAEMIAKSAVILGARRAYSFLTHSSRWRRSCCSIATTSSPRQGPRNGWREVRGLSPRTRLLRWGLFLVAVGGVLVATGPDAERAVADWLAAAQRKSGWYSSRILGFLAYGALAISVTYGLLLSTGIFRSRGASGGVAHAAPGPQRDRNRPHRAAWSTACARHIRPADGPPAGHSRSPARIGPRGSASVRSRST